MTSDPNGREPLDQLPVSFRPFTRGDIALMRRWLETPHVSEWWGQPLDEPSIESEYGRCIDGNHPTLVFVIELDGRPVGFLQTYLLSDNPDYESATGVENAAGVDLLIGDPLLVGRGVGSRALAEFVHRVGWDTYPDIARYMAGPSVANTRSRRAFEKAGFALTAFVSVPGEKDPEAVMVIERPMA